MIRLIWSHFLVTDKETRYMSDMCTFYERKLYLKYIQASKMTYTWKKSTFFLNNDLSVYLKYNEIYKVNSGLLGH